LAPRLLTKWCLGGNGDGHGSGGLGPRQWCTERVSNIRRDFLGWSGLVAVLATKKLFASAKTTACGPRPTPIVSNSLVWVLIPITAGIFAAARGAHCHFVAPGRSTSWPQAWHWLWSR